MTVADNLRKISAVAIPALEAMVDAADELKEVRKVASEQGIDWSQAKALLLARVRDDRDGGQRVEKLISKADNAAAYAAMLSMGNVAKKSDNAPQLKPVPRKPQLAAASSPLTRGDEAVPRVPSGAASPDSDESRANARDEARAWSPARGARQAGLSDGANAVMAPVAERASRLVTGRTVTPGRDGTNPAPISEAAPALGVVGGDRTDAASSHSAAVRSAGGGNLAGTETSGHSLSDDTNPSLDIRNQPFYRGGETWPR